MGLPKIREEEATFPRDVWGTYVMGWGIKENSPISIDLFRDPFGLMAVAICKHCGGRRESLLDARKFGEFLEKQRFDDAFSEAHAQARHMLHQIMDEWVPAHEKCEKRPIQYADLPIVTEFIDTAVKGAIRDLEKGIQVRGHLHVLESDGRVHALPIHDIPQSSDDNNDRASEFAARKAAVRRLIQARKGKVVAVVCISEAWASGAIPDPETGDLPEDDRSEINWHPWSDPNRIEVLNIVYATPAHSRAGMGVITRRGGVIDQGPADVGKIRWMANGHSSLLIDGLFGTDTLYPMTPEEEEAAQGVVINPSYGSMN